MHPGPLVFDGHLDLAMNALLCERDLALPLDAIREREASLPAGCPGTAMVSLPAMRAGGVFLCLSTAIARVKSQARKERAKRDDLDYASGLAAHAAARGQLAFYEALERAGEIRWIRDRASFAAHEAAWAGADLGGRSQDLPIGVIVTIEGADPILAPSDLADWWRRGVRTLMLAHMGPGRYAGGTRAESGLTDLGRALLAEMRALGMPLDLTHLSDTSFPEALDRFDGPVYASHSNARALAGSPRQLTDEQLGRIVCAGGVVGVVPYDRMLVFPREENATPRLPLERLADHVDHICQLAGDARHVAIGSDLDGGFGRESCPVGIDSIADLSHAIGAVLARRGYSPEDVAAVLSGNWLRFWRRALPSSGDPTTP